MEDKKFVSQCERGWNERGTRTLVIDGVPNGEDTEDGGKDRSSRRVLSGEIPGLQSSKARLRGWSLRKLRVKVDEGGQASSRSSGLHRRKQAVRARAMPAAKFRGVRGE